MLLSRHSLSFGLPGDGLPSAELSEEQVEGLVLAMPIEVWGTARALDEELLGRMEALRLAAEANRAARWKKGLN